MAQRPNIPGQGFDAYPSACLKSSPYAVLCARPGGFPNSQVILPLAPMVKHEEFLEVVRIEGHAFSLEDIALACDMYLLQVKFGIDESSIGACAQLVFAPIDKSFADDALWVPYGFRVIPLDPESALCAQSSVVVGMKGASQAVEAVS
ncbi:Homeobox-leucine zipper protein ATHB-14 [Trifolium repens]|nr:Homeobox-leucine zipper protein ATHB-14 [Trifolium repens]